MIDLLVISHACFMAINRKVYHLFKEDGWHVEIVVPQSLTFSSGVKQAEPPLENDPYLHYLPLIGTNPRIYFFRGLEKILNEKKPRIIFLDNHPVSQMALTIGRWCRNNDAKLFCLSCENLSLGIIDTVKRRGFKSIPATIYKRYLLYKTRPLVTGVCCINSDGKNIFLKEGYKKVERIPLGFDNQFFFIDMAKRMDLREKHQLTHITVAYFGRLIKEKGVHILIKALEGLKEYNWHLVMDSFDVYASDYAKEVNKMLQETRLKERVIFINPNHFEIAGYMNAVDIVAVPSIAIENWKEQYGRVAAETLACGKIVIASDSGALPELLGGHGILFSEGNIIELRNKLKLAFEQKLKLCYTPQEIERYAYEKLSIVEQKKKMQVFFETE